jgi:outer membrane protein assembly factor BamA
MHQLSAALRRGILLVIILIGCAGASAQVDADRNIPEYVDPTDLITLIKGKNSKKKETGIPEKGKLMAFAAPIIGSNPSLGAFYGLGGTGAMYLGEPDGTSISNLNASVLLTTKDQFVASLKGTIMTPRNDWEMLVDVKYSYFSENTFGLGSDDSQPVKESWNWGGIQTAGISGAQPMTFKQVKFHFTALKEITDNVYAGLGYHLDYHFDIEDLDLDLEAPEPVITSHYAYSQQKQFSTNAYTTSGASFNFVYDSRDHTVNPYHGKFLQVAYRVNSKGLGSERNSEQLYLEARYYSIISKKIPRHLIGFWGIGHWQVSGDLPYLHLPASGYDMRNRIGRGYVAGRFRGPGWLTLETEYRYLITKNGLLGGVLFGSITSTSRDAIEEMGISKPKLHLMEAMRPAGGFGLRLMLNRTGRLNIAMDMAFGQNGAKGFYFAVGETF